MSALDYPPPGHAAYIWHRGDALCIGLPGAQAGSGTTLVISLEKLGLDRSKAATRGWEVIMDVLFARRVAEGRSTIATPSMPTSRQLEDLLAGRSVPAWSADGRRKLAEGDLWSEENGEEHGKG